MLNIIYLGMWSLGLSWARLMANSLQLGAKHRSKSGLVHVFPEQVCLLCFSTNLSLPLLMFYKWQKQGRGQMTSWAAFWKKRRPFVNISRFCGTGLAVLSDGQRVIVCLNPDHGSLLKSPFNQTGWFPQSHTAQKGKQQQIQHEGGLIRQRRILGTAVELVLTAQRV